MTSAFERLVRTRWNDDVSRTTKRRSSAAVKRARSLFARAMSGSTGAGGAAGAKAIDGSMSGKARWRLGLEMVMACLTVADGCAPSRKRIGKVEMVGVRCAIAGRGGDHSQMV